MQQTMPPALRGNKRDQRVANLPLRYESMATRRSWRDDSGVKSPRSNRSGAAAEAEIDD
jgi:hypothetical protein